MKVRTPALFLGHGGGPLPLMNDPSHRDMVRTFSHNGRIWKSIHDPKVNAIVVVSAHYVASSELSSTKKHAADHENGKPSTILVQCEAQPKLLYDYFGFPPETYKYTMSNPGSVELAERIVSLVNENKSEGDCLAADSIGKSSPSVIHAKLDKRSRGFDHGVFVPMLALNAPSTLPIVTVSLANDYDASAHIALGQALAPLRNEGVLLVGSGLSFHNMGAFLGRAGADERDVHDKARLFDVGLETLIMDAVTGNVEDGSKLEKWRSTLSQSEFCHPTAEHLMPLFVVLGSAIANCGDTAHIPSVNSCDVAVEKIAFDVMGIPTCHFIFD